MKQTTLRKKFLALFSLLLLLAGQRAMACNATFTHTNACPGDTVWFYAQDQYAIYTWDFGDSTSQVNINHDTTTAHVYNTPGTYYVTLFVNIGAEWDYQTQIITIGTDCFNADFDTRCGGSNYMYFTDISTGTHTVSWNFGDPASGVNNTSVASAPYHLYPAAGNYTVTQIISNGTTADTLVRVVNVAASCVTGTIYYNISGNCMGDSTFMSVYYSGTPTSYLWNFGDPASGAANFSFLPQPKHLYSAPGMYNVMLVVSDGISTDTVHAIQTIIDCTVWPGDCNRDGEVNADDIFPIGMYYGNHGNARSAASTSFTSQPCTDWPNFNNFMYLQDLVNMKHADCNGDSTVNGTDKAAIVANYGMRHNTHNNVSGMPEATIADPSMYIQFPSSSVTPGSTVTGTVYLGTASKPIPYLYGYSFTINYDPAMIVSGSVSVNLNTNWLGNASNELMISQDNYAGGKIDAGVVRFDKVQVANGSGAIGTVTFTVKPTATGTLHTFFSTSAKVLSTQQFGSTASGNTEIFKPVNLVPADLLISAVGIDEQTADNVITVYPNPASSFITVLANNTEITMVTLSNALGQVVYSSKENFSSSFDISTSDLSKGIYTLSCTSKEGISVKKVSIIK